MDGTTSLHFLYTNFRVIYVRYHRVGEMVINIEGVLPLLANFSSDAPAAKALGITNFDDL